MSDSDEVPLPPDDPPALLAWAGAYRVLARLDDLVIAPDGPPGTVLPSRGDERFTYRDTLLGEPPEPGQSRRDRAVHVETARTYLHRIATLVARHHAARSRMDEYGRPPEDPALSAFLAKLSDERSALLARTSATRPIGTFEPVGVRVVRDPAPTLRYAERPLVGVRETGFGPAKEIGTPLLGWQDGPLRWAIYVGERVVAGEVSTAQQLAALVALIDFLRDPERADEQAEVSELLDLHAWQFALSSLDERLARLEREADRPGHTPERAERIGYRVLAPDGARVTVEPIVQRRGPRGRYSSGARLEWFRLADRKDLSPVDRRVIAAHEDRGARGSWASGGQLTGAQIFGVLQALIDRPAVFLEGDRDENGRIDIREGPLRLRFVRAADGALVPVFDLLGMALLPADVREALRDNRYLITMHRPQAAEPQVLMALLRPESVALVEALAIAPARFPPESHDALAARLEGLQETIDIEFPSDWTGTITEADRRIVVRLEILASGAIAVEMGIRPVAFGPLFAPGEGPALVLEGHGRDRHGARRDTAAERLAAGALAQRLGLGEPSPQPWHWRVSAGDAAFDLVAALKELVTLPAGAADPILVEWADDNRLLAMPDVSRRDLRIKVATDRDWLTVQGGASVEGQAVPLSSLLTAIREGWRYVHVGRRGFARIEEDLRRALARAEAALLDGDGLRQSPAAIGLLLELVDDDAQIDGSAAFNELRRRVRSGQSITPSLSPKLAQTLRAYQSAGVTWLARLAHWGAGALLADEMGLGKTIQTLAVLSHRAALGPALVVAPTSVVANWAAEAARFVPELRVVAYQGAERKRALVGLGPGDLLLTSYGVAATDRPYGPLCEMKLWPAPQARQPRFHDIRHATAS